MTLRLYALICELGSLTKAAESANMAVSAASRRLCLLEEELGSVLFKRLPHGLEPTMAGLATCVLSHLTEVPESRRIVESLTGSQAVPQVVVRVGSAPSGDAIGSPTPRRPVADVLEIRG